jgi:hypothetical protein
VAVYPGVGHLADGIVNDFARTGAAAADRTIHAPIAVLMAAVARRLSAWDFDYEDRGAEPTEYDTLCSSCRREREVSPPPLPADPSAQRLTEAALASHTRVAERSRARSRSPRDHRRCTHCGDSEDEPEEYETICAPCLRRRDAHVPMPSTA